MTNIPKQTEMLTKLTEPRFNSSSSYATKPQSLKELEEAAGQFEAIFLKMFLDQARQSKLSDDLLGSSASDNFQEMFDSELSQAGSASFNLGLTDVIVRQLRTDLVK
ncbi:rod-binding protein [Planktomarina temperata]|jgi:Rod binding domain-containing protein|nr:rod-binding protein [Planktomarina temperata]MDA9940955.1 rod-binding protein [Planktomarina temperata]